MQARPTAFGTPREKQTSSGPVQLDSFAARNEHLGFNNGRPKADIGSLQMCEMGKATPNF